MLLPTHILPLAASTVAPLAERVTQQGLSFAETLLGLGRSGPPAASQPEGSLELQSPGYHEHLFELRERELDSFLDRFLNSLRQLDLDSSLGIDLKLSGRQDVVVDGDHPRRADIEELFVRNSELADGFRRTVAAATAHQRITAPENSGRDLRISIQNGSAAFRWR